jgi:hypothetical protein
VQNPCYDGAQHLEGREEMRMSVEQMQAVPDYILNIYHCLDVNLESQFKKLTFAWRLYIFWKLLLATEICFPHDRAGQKFQGTNAIGTAHRYIMRKNL